MKTFIYILKGSGKTIVYAAPIVSALQTENEDGFISRLNRPRVLVVAPSRELATQILVTIIFLRRESLKTLQKKIEMYGKSMFELQSFFFVIIFYIVFK